jgi:hypothetical protein
MKTNPRFQALVQAQKLHSDTMDIRFHAQSAFAATTFVFTFAECRVTDLNSIMQHAAKQTCFPGAEQGEYQPIGAFEQE